MKALFHVEMAHPASLRINGVITKSNAKMQAMKCFAHAENELVQQSSVMGISTVQMEKMKQDVSTALNLVSVVIVSIHQNPVYRLVNAVIMSEIALMERMKSIALDFLIMCMAIQLIMFLM